MSIWENKYAVLGLLAAVLLAYSNSFTARLTFDNRSLILNDYRVKEASAENLGLILTQEYWFNKTATGLYRPLTTFSYLFNYAILGNGSDPAGYHWINLALHLLNMALVYALGRILLREPGPAMALAAIWGLHPVLTESVTNVVGRSDLLAALGLLAGLLCYIRGRRAPGRSAVKWLLGLLFAAAIGIFAKESAAVLPAVMVIYDLAYRKAVTWRDRAPGYAAAALPLLIFLAVRARVLGRLPAMHVAFVDNPLTGAGFWTARITAVKVIGKYLWLLAWPRNLCCDYSYNQVGGVDWRAWLALAVCLAAAAAALAGYKRNRPVFFFIAFSFVTLAPTANIAILIGTIMAERFLYLPAIGFAGCVVVAARAAGRWGVAAVAALAIVFAVRTYVRNFDWNDDATLAASTVRTCPDNFKAHMMQAGAVRDSEGIESGIAEIERSLAILNPLRDARNSAMPYLTAGTFYRQKGDRLAPKLPAEGQFWYRKALDTLIHATKMEGGSSFQLDLELGRAWLRLQQPSQAVTALQKGLDRGLQPELFVELSAAHRALGEPRQAVSALMQAYVLDTSDRALLSQLVQLYREAEPQSCAVANGLNLDCPSVRAEVCRASINVAARYDALGLAGMARLHRRHAADLGCR